MLGLASWVELPEVLDVPGVLDRFPVLRLQVRGSRPGDMDDLERALPQFNRVNGCGKADAP